MTAFRGRVAQRPRDVADLLVVATYTLFTGLFVIVPPLNRTFVRSVFALGFLFFVPGYAIVSMLLPRRQDATDRVGHQDAFEGDDRSPGIGEPLERIVYAVGVSIALTTAVGLTLGYNRGGFTSKAVFGSLAVITAACLVIATLRRVRIPASERFTVDPDTVTDRIVSAVVEPSTGANAILNVLVLVAFVLAVVSVGAVLSTQKGAPTTTEFYLLAENDDGEFVASNYPATLPPNESESFVLGIGNHEDRQVTYTVVFYLQQFDGAPPSATPASQLELDRVQTTLMPGESRELTVSISPVTTGRNYRLVFLLYSEEPPETPTVENAYRELHLWVDITEESA